MRAKFQVLVLLFKRVDDEILYCVFRRKDIGIFQFLSGGGEENETILEAAKRETLEESGITADKLIQLDTKASIPKDIFPQFRDQKGFYIVTEYSFAYELSEKDQITLSKEHSGCQWVNSGSYGSSQI